MSEEQPIQKQNQNQINEKDEIPVYESFEDMDLKEELLRGIYASGYEKPSVIQQKGIKAFIQGGDLIARLNLVQEKRQLFQ